MNSHPEQELAARLLAFVHRLRAEITLEELCRELEVQPRTTLFNILQELNCSRVGAYGSAPFGKASYGGTRRTSDGKSSVPRRVTVNGQVCYRGQMYSIGRMYAGRTCQICERGDQLLLMFHDRRPIFVTKV